MLGAQCHAIRVRLSEPDPPELIAERFAAVGPSGLWVEEVPAAAAQPVAERRRAAELTRPVADLRGVLLRYRDGTADLVVVADRGSLDEPALRQLAATVAGVTAPDTLPRLHRPVPGTPATVAVAPAPDWGLADGREGASATYQIILPEDAAGDRASWLAALAVTVCRYDRDDGPGVAVLGTEHGAVRVRPVGTLGDLRGQAPVPVDAPVVAGLLIEDGPGADPDTDGRQYVACLAPPFPLTISRRRLRSGVELRCDYRLSHVAPAIVAQFVRHLAYLHQQVLRSPATPVADAVLLDADEQARIAALGRPSTPLVTEAGAVHAAFSRVAAATPDAVALCDGGTRLSYRELDERSGRVANALRGRGVRAGDRVGVCLERSADLVVVLLGVLKAGAVYVPSDPDYPIDRLAYTARDAQVAVVVTTVPKFPRQDGVECLSPADLTRDAADGSAGTSAAATSTVTGDDPAYVIYTSGSTGRPKGVVVAHRSVVSLIDATRDEYRLGPDDVWTVFHSSAFDFSVWEIWGCLLTGGRLVVVPYPVSRDPERFRDLLVSQRCTVLSQTPSAFSQLLAVDHAGLTVRLVVFGGEPLDARMLLPWFDQHPESRCRMVNMFGITETTVHVTAQTVTRQHALSGSRSVGPALPGWHLYVMDAAGRLLPPGVAGEIYVGGAGVALRYLNREELTAERFRPDQFTTGRVYRSGDRGRLRPDGALEHLGRIDSQVKIRGFRIELDEIRSVLLEDPEVRAAAVLVRRDNPDDAATARIDAYVVLSGGDPANVRKRAAAMLPEYMVPASVTAVPTLPLTANGKLDATRLPAPARAAERPAGPPTDDEELAGRLGQVWTEVLGTPVGPDDDFFELGGNSLFAVRIVAAMRAGGLPALQLRELYRHPTIRSVVAILGERRG